MAPDPAPVRIGRGKIKVAGKDLDKEGLLVLTRKELNNLANNMRNTMAAEPKKKYKELKSDDERRDWLVYCLIDPKTTLCTGLNSLTAIDEEQNKKKESWITEEQNGKPQIPQLGISCQTRLRCEDLRPARP